MHPVFVMGYVVLPVGRFWFAGSSWAGPAGTGGVNFAFFSVLVWRETTAWTQGQTNLLGSLKMSFSQASLLEWGVWFWDAAGMWPVAAHGDDRSCRVL